MKRILLLVALWATCSAAAQVPDSVGNPEVIYGRKIAPQLRGGEADLFRKWAQAEFDRRCLEKFPYLARMCEPVPLTRIAVSFRIDERGEVQDITVLQSPDPELSAVAVSVIADSPRWGSGIRPLQEVDGEIIPAGAARKLIFLFYLDFADEKQKEQ